MSMHVLNASQLQLSTKLQPLPPPALAHTHTFLFPTLLNQVCRSPVFLTGLKAPCQRTILLYLSGSLSYPLCYREFESLTFMSEFLILVCVHILFITTAYSLMMARASIHLLIHGCGTPNQNSTSRPCKLYGLYLGAPWKLHITVSEIYSKTIWLESQCFLKVLFIIKCYSQTFQNFL